jgi:phage terminase small subunit
MTRKLTDKQEAYKNNRIKGMGVSESYKAAYPDQTMSDKAVSVEANKLEQDPRIALAILESKEKATERALVTVEDVVKGLLLEAQTNGEGSTQGARVSAWKHLGEYTGSFDANKQKVEHSGELDLNTLTDEQIKSRIIELMQ